MRKHRRPMQILATMVLALAIGCSDAPPEEKKVSRGIAVDPSTVGRISARVGYQGALPAPKAIVMSSTPQCALAHQAPVYEQSLVVKDGRLQNAIVYIERGLENFSFTAPSNAVEIDQKGCLYEPRVTVAMVGQPVDFLNSDAEAHNVHGFPNILGAWNFMLSRKGAKRTMKFDRQEVAVRLGCDIHPWMRGYLGVTSHPFAAVTPANGEVTLEGVPPGRYTISVWHETMGQQSQEIELSANGEATVEFNYTG